MEVVTLPRMSTTRAKLNKIAMDIIYYQSPVYGIQVNQSVVQHLCNYAFRS